MQKPARQQGRYAHLDRAGVPLVATSLNIAITYVRAFASLREGSEKVRLHRSRMFVAPGQVMKKAPEERHCERCRPYGAKSFIAPGSTNMSRLTALRMPVPPQCYNTGSAPQSHLNSHSITRDRVGQRSKNISPVVRAEQLLASPFRVGHHSQDISVLIADTRDVRARSVRI